MKVFRLKADALFYAEDFDDALNNLVVHFMALLEGSDNLGGYTEIDFLPESTIEVTVNEK